MTIRIKKILLLTLLYSLIGIIITALPLYYIDRMLSVSDITDTETDTVSANQPEVLDKDFSILVPTHAKDLSLTANHDLITYLLYDSLVIKDIHSGKIVNTIIDTSPIIHAVPLHDRNMILYFTQKIKEGSQDSQTAPRSSALEIKTYDIDKNEYRTHKLQNEFVINYLSAINNIKYSTLTNIIYMDVTTKQNNREKHVIYRLNIMKEVVKYSQKEDIADFEMLNHTDALIYQDSQNNIFIKNTPFKDKNFQKAKLLGVDMNDNIYLLAPDQENKVLVYKDKALVNTLPALQDTNIKSVFHKDGNVCLIYDDYMVDLVNQKTYSIVPDAEILAVSKSHIIYHTAKGNVFCEKKELTH